MILFICMYAFIYTVCMCVCLSIVCVCVCVNHKKIKQTVRDEAQELIHQFFMQKDGNIYILYIYFK